MFDMSLQLQIAILDPAELANAGVEDQCENCRQNEGNQDESGPVERRDGFSGSRFDFRYPAGVDADLTDETAGTHTG